MKRAITLEFLLSGDETPFAHGLLYDEPASISSKIPEKMAQLKPVDLT